MLNKVEDEDEIHVFPTVVGALFAAWRVLVTAKHEGAPPGSRAASARLAGAP